MNHYNKILFKNYILICSRFREVIQKTCIHETIEQKYSSLFFNMIDLNIKELNFRFDPSNIQAIIEMANVLKRGF